MQAGVERMKKTTLPVGMHDKLFKRARVTYTIERDISDFLMSQGFHRIETPTLEHFEVFNDSVTSNHYHFFDKSGELLTLRPDITSQIGRVIASTQVETPIKFSYSGKVFKYNEEMRGLTNEHTQAGIEIVGYPAKEAVCEAMFQPKKLWILQAFHLTNLNCPMQRFCRRFLKPWLCHKMLGKHWHKPFGTKI